MRFKHLPICFMVSASVCTGLGTDTFGAAASFQGLGDLSGGVFNSAATAVSDNGLVVVGSSESASGTEAFYWSLSQGMIGLGDLPGGPFNSVANDVSADGSVIVGQGSRGSIANSEGEAFVWTLNDGMVGLGDLPGGYEWSTANSISADGSVIVGSGYEEGNSTFGKRAFYWTADTGIVNIGYPLFPNIPNQEGFSSGQAVSADGSVIVGGCNHTPNYVYGGVAYRWDASTGFNKLGMLPSSVHVPGSGAIAVSADGSVVVGNSSSEDYGRPASESFYWTAEGDMVGLGFIYDPYYHFAFDNYVAAVSADGSVVVGKSDSDINESGKYRAYIWSADEGMQFLHDVLTNDLGLDLTGWTLTEATGISADGLTVVGTGINPNGETEAFIARLPEPGMLGLLGIGVAALFMRRVGA